MLGGKFLIYRLGSTQNENCNFAPKGAFNVEMYLICTLKT